MILDKLKNIQRTDLAVKKVQPYGVALLIEKRFEGESELTDDNFGAIFKLNRLTILLYPCNYCC